VIKLEDAQKFFEYKDSFEKFALDFFGLESTQVLTTKEVTCCEPEELLVAHMVWKLTFNHNQTYLAIFPNMRIAEHWRRLVLDYYHTLPEYMRTEVKTKHSEISTGTRCDLLFRVCDPNTGRGMTISTLYMIEPNLMVYRKYQEFMYSILPVMSTGDDKRQVIQFSRGY